MEHEKDWLPEGDMTFDVSGDHTQELPVEKVQESLLVENSGIPTAEDKLVGENVAEQPAREQTVDIQEEKQESEIPTESMTGADTSASDFKEDNRGVFNETNGFTGAPNAPYSVPNDPYGIPNYPYGDSNRNRDIPNMPYGNPNGVPKGVPNTPYGAPGHSQGGAYHPYDPSFGSYNVPGNPNGSQYNPYRAPYNPYVGYQQPDCFGGTPYGTGYENGGFYAPMPSRKKNRKPVIGLIFSLIAMGFLNYFPFVAFICGIFAICMSYVGLRKDEVTTGQKVCGLVGLGLGVFALIISVAMLVMLLVMYSQVQS